MKDDTSYRLTQGIWATSSPPPPSSSFHEAMGPCGLDSWSSGEGTRTLAGLPARGPPKTRSSRSRLRGFCPERMGEGSGR